MHPKPWSDDLWCEYNARFGDRVDSWLDAGHGDCVLRQDEVREFVKQSLMKYDGERMHIHAAVIMPNHVHILMEPLGEYSLPQLLKGIKGASARLANKHLNRNGAFWMNESYDHIVRSGKEYRHFIRYIFENPGKARLTDDHYWLYLKE